MIAADTPEEEGLFSRAVKELFRRLAAHQSDDSEDNAFDLTCSVLEIYNEEVFDLLAPLPQRKALPIREHFSKAPINRTLARLSSHKVVSQDDNRAKTAKPKLRRAQTSALTPSAASNVQEEGFYVEGCKELPCSNAEELVAAVNQALMGRRVASHDMNDRSSRSHCLVTLRLQSRRSLQHSHGDTPGTPGALWTSRLTLVDLAGSERLKETNSTGVTLKEGQHINRSLFSLGQVRAVSSDTSSTAAQ